MFKNEDFLPLGGSDILP